MNNISTPNYRPDIDGLRAIAVLSVIVYHLHPTALTGGFTGVDIFFVISGFLITQNIMSDLRKKQFSFLNFYHRRVKRIIPAMLVVVLVSVLIAQSIMRPADAELVAESGVWSLLSLANVYFWLFQDTSYFAAASSELPLLHLWSLGVEEQFYLIWPICLVLLFRFTTKTPLLIIICLFICFSIALGELLFSDMPSFVYYMLPARAGELLLGALLAIGLLHIPTKNTGKAIPYLACISGVVMMAYSIIGISEYHSFPGVNALYPSLGCALIIFAGHFHQGHATRWLTFKPMVGVGLMSYSAYLWHWPVIAFYRYGHADLTLLASMGLSVVILFLAWLSYRFVETPCRQAKGSVLRIFLTQLILPTAAIGALCLLAMKLDGFGFRWYSTSYIAQYTQLKADYKPAYEYNYICQRESFIPSDLTDSQCIIGHSNNENVDVLLMGDSNAAHYAGVIGEFAADQGFAFRNIQLASCPPVDGTVKPFLFAKRVDQCQKSKDMLFASLDSYSTLIISANWSFYQARSAQFFERFSQTIERLSSRHKKIILLGKVPIFSQYDRLCGEKSLSYPGKKCQFSPELMTAKVQVANTFLENLSHQFDNVEYIDFNNALCKKGQCSVYDQHNKSLYFDQEHLSISGSWQLGKNIVSTTGTPQAFRDIDRNSIQNNEH
ncbi:acyltransferase [Aliiglaciecola sp.]|nr:acyltransferase [Aliiglaciecola sp.]